MAKPGVTVLIPTYNRAQFLPEALESLFGQTLPPAQVIVINDGSTDNTGATLASFKGKIDYIETRNRGKSAALNTGMSRVNGDYVWILDDDNVALPDALERFVRALEQRGDCGFAYSGFYISKTHRENGEVEIEREWQLPEVTDDDFLICLMEANFLCGSGTFVRSTCYRDLGPFREDLIRSQDYEMALRLSRKYRGAKLDSPTFHSRQHEGLRGSSRDSFSPDKNVEKWRHYDQKFFRELRRDLDLHEYLPRSFEKAELGATDIRRAYLQRMTIMASKGLYDEMIEDLQLALQQDVDSVDLSDSVRFMIARAVSYASADDSLFASSVILPRVKTLCTGSAFGGEVLFEFLRGLYWRAWHSCKRGSLRHALKFFLAFVRLGGYRGIARSFQYKLGHT